MLLGFSDQNAFDQVMADARPHYRRVSSKFTAQHISALEAATGQVAPAAWLAHGGLCLGRLVFEGFKPILPAATIGSRRCLVPTVGLNGECRMLAGMWTPTLNGIDPKAFYLIKVDGETVEIAVPNWDNWLNPERDVRPMLHRSKRLVVPQH